MRKLIFIILSVVLLVVSFFLAKYLIANKKKVKPSSEKIVNTAYTKTVLNSTIPIKISTTGNLVAKNKIDLYAEVQGVLEISKKDFKPGTHYLKGQTIIKINSNEFNANIKVQKSNLYNAIISIMPDIRLDYTEEYTKWQSYLQNFNINKEIQNLPKHNSEKEKFFISGRGITSAYYNVKNLEAKLNKYTLRAPFNGILTESLVTPGTLIRQGQKIGEFIDPSVYEVSVAVKSEYRDLLEIGKKVELYNLEKTKTWIGNVVRINGKVDASTQTINAFIQVQGKDLKDGQYLEVALHAKSENNAYEVKRKLLINNSKLFIVKDSKLSLTPILKVFENKNSVILKGLKDGTQLLSKPIPGAFEGMLVKVLNENKN